MRMGCPVGRVGTGSVQVGLGACAFLSVLRDTRTHTIHAVQAVDSVESKQTMKGSAL